MDHFVAPITNEEKRARLYQIQMDILVVQQQREEFTSLNAPVSAYGQGRLDAFDSTLARLNADLEQIKAVRFPEDDMPMFNDAYKPK